MTSSGPLGSAPLSALDGGSPPAGDPYALSDGLVANDELAEILRNVLEDAAALTFPTGDAYIANLLESAVGIAAGGVGNLRQRAEASTAAMLALDTASQILSVLKERILVAAVPDALGRFRNTLAAGGVFQDAVAAAWSMLLADSGNAQDSEVVVLRKLAGVADSLLAMGDAQGRMSALAAVAVAAALEGRATAGWGSSAADQATLVDESRALLAAMLSLNDAGAGSDTAEAAMRMVLLADDAATIADDPAAMLRAFSDLADGAVLYCTLRIGGTDYQGWVMNTDLRAVTEYRNVPFDSFATLNGRTYAAGEGGIFELAGDTDDGQPIEAWFRPFLTNFGTQKMKRVTDIWIGAAATGLVVKVHTRNPATGQMTEDLYPVQHVHGDGTDKGRVKVGRGLTSNWWTLTVANVAGAAFEVDSIEWKPLVLDRRQ